jgi:hypothetical protein
LVAVIAGLLLLGAGLLADLARRGRRTRSSARLLALHFSTELPHWWWQNCREPVR